ncbi:hypothetical protein [Nitrosococcus watsonii]|uniref:Uncharacterized protein n=1 Tax=Nitrosococcus watsoni (strain C-113) TaxID=105559 RepID=D8K564_NITWC|nr:hypothetical protein [Nitrosococcus watsonii]ADJ28041.1 conserved hypothetical protein [Nitrosococcus watsonii C-113]
MSKKITLFSLLLALWGASSLVLAHTIITDQATEGTGLYTGFDITHGCGFEDKPSLPVIAQSVAFPTGPNSAVTRMDTGEAISLGDVLIGGMHASGLINPAIIQNRDVFNATEELRDETGVVRGVHYTDGELQVDLDGVLPFRVSGVTFVEESCVTKVRARVAIANWCHHREGARRVDVWIARLTPVFNDERVVSIDFWPTLTINRDLTTNPLPENCGEGYEVAVEPSDEDIDQYLPMPGFIPGI